MKFLLLILLLVTSCLVMAQETQLHILKKGKIKKRFQPGTYVRLTDHAGNSYVGGFYILNDSNIFISKVTVPVNEIASLKILRHRNREAFDWRKFGYSTLGVALSTAGMTLSNWEPLPRALAYSAVIGYSHYAFSTISKISLKKRTFRFRKQTRLRIWSLTNFDAPRPF